jgi:hypothetical protein
VVPLDGKFPSEPQAVQVKPAWRAADIVRAAVPADTAPRYCAFAVRKDRLGLDPLDSTLDAAGLTDQSVLVIQHDIPDLVPIAALKRTACRLTPTGDVFYMKLTLPLRLDGANTDLLKTIADFYPTRLSGLFVLRKDQRTVSAGQCYLDAIQCVCVIICS